MKSDWLYVGADAYVRASEIVAIHPDTMGPEDEHYIGPSLRNRKVRTNIYLRDGRVAHGYDDTDTLINRLLNLGEGV